MKYRITFSARATSDLTNLFDYLLKQTSEKTSRHFVEGIYNYCLEFDTFPQRGLQRDDIRPGLRLVGYRRHACIAFAVIDDEVVILRILMRGQNVGREISEDIIL